MKRIEQFLYSPLYPLLFSIYPVLSMFSYNLYQTYVFTLFVPLFFSLMIGLFSLLIYKRWFGDWHLAAFASTMTLFLFFSYGHILDSVSSKSLYLYKSLPAIWVILFLIAVWGTSHLRGKVDFPLYAPALNLMAIIMLLFPIARFIRVGLLSAQPFTFQVDNYMDLSNANIVNKPDIYYIILDGYGRSDQLSEEFNYDNREFLNALTDMGFKVADCSQSNYSHTGHSLTSALNLEYLQDLNPIFSTKLTNVFYFAKALKANSLERSLKTAGYTTVAFSSGFPWAELNADHFIFPKNNSLISEFDALLMKTTFLRVLEQYKLFPSSSLTDIRYRQRLASILSSYDELAQISSPKFVFMHILAAHAPYVVDSKGNNISPEYRNADEGYVEQSQYVSHKVVEMVQRIISTSNTPPIIVIQGDHGPNLEGGQSNSFLILNAYFLPGNSDLIYSTISPVNTFRLILNTYFDTDFPLLEDTSYLVDDTKPGNFNVVPNNCVSQMR